MVMPSAGEIADAKRAHCTMPHHKIIQRKGTFQAGRQPGNQLIQNVSLDVGGNESLV